MGHNLSQNSSASSSQWHVLGAGAIGRLWAAKLLESQCLVSLIQRDNAGSSDDFIHLTDGPNVSASKSYRVQKTNARSLLKQRQAITNLIIATKSFDAVDALKNIAPLLSANASILVLCNGLGIQTALAAILNEHCDSAKLYWGVSSDGAILTGDDKLIHTGHGTTHIGLMQSNIKSSQQQLKLPKQLDLDIQHVEKVRPFIWQKFFINCVINPSTVFFDCQNGALITQVKPHHFFQQLCAELQSVYNSLLYDNKTKGAEELDAGFNLYLAAKHVAMQTADNTSSMLQDTRRGKRTEIAALNHHLLSLAAKHSVACPLNCQLVEHIQSLNRIVAD